MNNNTVYCFSYFYPKSGHIQDLIQVLLKLIPPTRAEAGCLQYELLIADDETIFIMLEKFISKEALSFHEQQPYIKYFVENEMLQYCDKVSWHVATPTACY